jgi:hypothetical protein
MLQQIRAISSKGSDPFDDKEWEKIKKKIKWQQGLGQELEQGQIAPNTTLPSGFDQHIQAGWSKKAYDSDSAESKWAWIEGLPVEEWVDSEINDYEYDAEDINDSGIDGYMRAKGYDTQQLERASLHGDSDTPIIAHFEKLIELASQHPRVTEAMKAHQGVHYMDLSYEDVVDDLNRTRLKWAVGVYALDLEGEMSIELGLKGATTTEQDIQKEFDMPVLNPQADDIYSMGTSWTFSSQKQANSDIKFVDLSLPHWKDSLLKDVNWDHIDEDSMFPAADFEDVPYSFQYDSQSKTVYYGNGWTHHADIKAQGGKGRTAGTFDFEYGYGTLELYNSTAQVFDEIKEAFADHFKVEVAPYPDDSPDWTFSSVKQSSIQIHEYPVGETADPIAMDSRPFVIDKDLENIHIGPKGSFHYDLLQELELQWDDILTEGRIDYRGNSASIDVYSKDREYCNEIEENLVNWMRAEEPGTTFITNGGQWTFSSARPRRRVNVPKRINDNKDPYDDVTSEELKPWQPGEYGKFIGTPDQVHTWINQANPYYDGEDAIFDGWPAHQGVADMLGLGQMFNKNMDSNYAAGHISPDGGVTVLDDLHGTVDKMIQQDPRLHKEEGWTFSKVAQVVPQWAGDPEDMDPGQQQMYPILYASGKLYVGYEGLHHINIIESLNIPQPEDRAYRQPVEVPNDSYLGLISFGNSESPEFEPNSISWFKPLSAPPNWQEAEQALSQFFNTKLWTDREEWRFGKVVTDLDEFDPLSDDDYMGEDFDDQAIKDLLQQGVRRGRPGKGLKLPDGNLVYWEDDVHGAPHHMDVLQTLGVRDIQQVGFFMVSREGDITNDNNFNNQEWEFE